MNPKDNRTAMQLSRTIIIVSVVLFPTLTNLVRHSGSTLLVLFALSGLPMALSSRFRPALERHEKGVIWAFAAYSLVYILSFITNGLLGTLTDLRLSHLDHEIRFLAIVPIFMLFKYFKISQASLWTGILTGALLAGGYAISQHFVLELGERVKGSYHAIAFGDISLVLAFMSVPAMDYLKTKSTAVRLIPPAALLFGLTASILSATRGAWIAIPAFIVVLFFYSASMFSTTKRALFLGVIICLFLAANYMPSVDISGRVDEVKKEVSDYWNGDRSYSSVGSRLDGWLAGLEIFGDHPVIGAGPGNYEPILQQMVKEGKPYEIAVVHSQPHGAYPSVMADCGILGLMALLGIFALPLKVGYQFIRYRKPIRHLGYALVILVIGFMHFGITETIFSLNINVTFYIILTAAIMAVAANEWDRLTAFQQDLSLSDPSPNN